MEAVKGARGRLDRTLVSELARAADRLFEAENVGPLEPDWPLLDADATVALATREMLRRRERWAREYGRVWPPFRRQVLESFSELLKALPESYGAREDEPFTVPLSSMLEQPAETLERLLLSFYDEDARRYDLFHDLRAQIAANYVIASGFSPGTDPREVQERLLRPTRHKSRNAAELARLYLNGTPFEDVLTLPMPFRVPEELRFEHCHVIGGTGHGKTQLLQRMIHADLVAAQQDGRSVVVVDSQGDLIQKLVRLDLFAPDTPGTLADRLILIDPADVEYPPSLNLFDVHRRRVEEYRPADRERALNGLVELYENFFGALLGAELTQKQGVIFRYLARLMLVIPGATIHTLMEIMEDGKPYRSHMEGLDGSARHFFATEFFHPSFAATKKQILKRLWGVLSVPAFERMFAQLDNKVDIFQATRDGAIILISTAKDLLKTDGSALLGRFFIGMLSQAALERAMLPAHARTPTFVYVDEAQEYFDDTIETILSQARKYRVGITLAHQTLDQLSPQLRAAFLSNTSFKCAGGVSAKDARALAPELHTSPDFIEGMRRRRDRSEFAAWLKHRTAEAIQLEVPLGFLERQPTLSDEAYDALISRNRSRYCGTLDEILAFKEHAEKPASAPVEETVQRRPQPPSQAAAVRPTADEAAPPPVREMGKGGPKHRYLQALVKELAEQQGFRATVEAPLPGGGQADVLVEQDGVSAAFEISVSTGADHEVENVRKCLGAGVNRVALVLHRSPRVFARYREGLLERLHPQELERVSILRPEDLPDYIAAIGPPPPPEEKVVRGYKLKVTRSANTPEEARERREMLARLIARTLDNRD